MRHQPASRPLSSRSAFTLLELLVVVGLMAFFLAMALPAVGNILSAHRRGKVLLEIVSLLDLARSEAMSRQRLTWVGLEQVTDATTGEVELRGVVMTVPSGNTKTLFSGGSHIITSAVPITQTYRWKDVELVNRSALDKLAPLMADAGSSVSIASLATQTFRFGGSTMPRLPYKTIAFTPQGYALTNPRPTLMTPYEERIDIGLQPTPNTGAKDDQMAIILNGFSGRTEVYRR